jgi:hypothetical protein
MDNKEVPEVEQGQVIEPAEEQQAPSMPEEEQKPTEATGQLPDAASERTKLEFEKLKAHNRDLADKLKQQQSTQYGTNVFESVYGQTPRTQVAPPATPLQGRQEVPNFVDENGYVDTEALKRSLNEATTRAQRAEQEAKLTRDVVRQQEEKRQIKEAHEKYPWLNPDPTNDQFDRDSFELVRDRIVRNMWEGREQSLSEIAEEVSKFHTPSVKSEEIKEQAVAEFKKTQTVKAQASAVQTGRGQPREENVRLDELRDRTRRGDDSALNERLKNI